MPYNDLDTEVVFNEISEEQLKNQTNLPPNQYWLTPEDDVNFPIGSIYISTNKNTKEPAELFGGTWVQIKDKFLLASGDVYSVGSEGGSADAVVVSHNHSITVVAGSAGSYNAYPPMSAAGGTIISSTGVIAATGVDGTGKNMPPYLAVKVWERIS